MQQGSRPELFRWAKDAVTKALRKNPSLIGFASDDVVSRAVEEYLRKEAEYAAKGEPILNPQGLMTTIARSRAKDAQLKWNKEKDHLEIGDSETHARKIEELPHLGPRTSAEVLAREDSVEGRARVSELLTRLVPGERDRAIAFRNLVEEHSAEEIAADFGLAPKTVFNILTRIKQALRDELGDGRWP